MTVPPNWNLQVKPTRGEIYELSTNVTLYMQRIPRLQVQWKDNLPAGESLNYWLASGRCVDSFDDSFSCSGTTYNVLVSAVNSTRCPDAPCSEYTIKGKPRHFIYLPQSPNPNVESSDCNYMFGCQYNVTVETSNLLVRRSMRVFIPRNYNDPWKWRKLFTLLWFPSCRLCGWQMLLPTVAHPTESLCQGQNGDQRYHCYWLHHSG